MPQLISNRDFVLASTLGHAINFEKGVPTDVPKALIPEAMEKGCVPVEPLEFEETKSEEAPTDQVVRDEAIEAAFRAIVARNNISDFSAAGVPSKEALRAETGWDIHPKERSRIWDKVKPTLNKG